MPTWLPEFHGAKEMDLHSMHRMLCERVGATFRSTEPVLAQIINNASIEWVPEHCGTHEDSIVTALYDNGPFSLGPSGVVIWRCS